MSSRSKANRATGNLRRHGQKTETPPRTIRAILFGDVKGFSRLADDRVPAFEREVLGACAEAIKPFAKSLRYRYT
jgi:hypothetical protein